MVKHVIISSDVLVNHLSERCLHYHYCLTRSCPEEGGGGTVKCGGRA